MRRFRRGRKRQWRRECAKIEKRRKRTALSHRREKIHEAPPWFPPFVTRELMRGWNFQRGVQAPSPGLYRLRSGQVVRIAEAPRPGWWWTPRYLDVTIYRP